MLHSRPFHALCCLNQAHVIQFCLGAAELRRLGIWRDEWRSGFSPHVWARGQLQRGCSRNPTLAAAVADLLDLAHLDVIASVRDMDNGAVARLVQAWVEEPYAPALPALLWATVCDPRGDVHNLGTRLGHEAAARAAAAFVGTTDACRRSGEPGPSQTRTLPSTDSSDA